MSRPLRTTPGATRRAGLAPYLLVAPFVALFAVFMLYPLGRSAVLSTERTFGPAATEFVGLENFALLAVDPMFWRATRNTVLFTAASVFVQVPLALALALALNRTGLLGRSAYRLIFFLPQLAGMVFTGMIASLMFEKRTGVINIALEAALPFGPSAVPGVALGESTHWIDFPWLQVYVVPMLILAALWVTVGFNMVYFLAALQTVNRSLVDAARIDGADAWRRFIHVTLPAIRPVASFVVLLSIIGGIQLFELPFVIYSQSSYGSAGPNDRALTLVMYLYREGFESGDLGYASAIGWVMSIALFAVGLAHLGLSARWRR